MKIDEQKALGPVAASEGARASATPDPQPAPVDRVTTGAADDLRASVETGISLATAERATRLHELIQQVRTGAYRPSASALGDQILAEADLDSRLARAIH